MIPFLLGCAGLLLLAALFSLYRRRRSDDVAEDLRAANLQWYRARQAELEEEGRSELSEDARLRLLEDEQQGQDAHVAPLADKPFPLWLVPLLVCLLSAGLYYRLGAAEDVMIARALQAMDGDSTEAEMQALLQRMEERVAQRPENLDYLALLGRFHMGMEDYARAAVSYRELADASPGDAQAMAYAAQAEYLARGRELSQRAQVYAERALAIDPHQRTALGLLGMAAFEQGEYRGAIQYWQRLLAVETPGSEGARMIEGVIASARARLGETGPQAAEATAASAGVNVRVRFPEGAQFDPADTVFVLARAADAASRMPVAVKRLTAAELPRTLRLDDAASMAGQKLSELAEVRVVVQVSPDGRPGEAGASWLGAAGPLTPSVDGEAVEVVLAPRL